MTTGPMFALAIALGLLVPGAPSPTRAPQEPTRAERVTAVASKAQYRLDFDGERFAGPAWEFLVEEGREAQFFLVGEQHGIAENARLVAALFETLAPAGYEHVAIETSPPMANVMDRVLREEGIRGLRKLFAQSGAQPAFFGMKEEAEFLASARATVSAPAPVLWGLDYEVAADRHLIRRLQAEPKPPQARDALAILAAASAESWRQYEETRNPQFIFSFNGDPTLARRVADSWPDRNDAATWILDTLESTLQINELWTSGNGFLSNEKRAELLRSNFLRHWRAEKAAGRSPRVLFKFGASHMMRGLNTNETFDLGALLPEVAAVEDGTTFSMLVLAGAESNAAVFDPVRWTYEPARPNDRYGEGLEPIVSAAPDDGFTLVDLRALRPLLPPSAREEDHHALMRTVHGFDVLLILTGSTPSEVFR